jgi:hypothetical protein
MTTKFDAPVRLASEDVIINAPMSYAGSAQRIMRLRRRMPSGWQLVAITLLALLLIAVAWVLVTGWYLIWGLWLVPYRLLRRGARKRKVESLRHRELMGTIQGSAAASAAAVVAGLTTPLHPVQSDPRQLIADADREQAIADLREHMLVGRLMPEEFEQRLDLAQRARTRADLEGVRAGLPAAPVA